MKPTMRGSATAIREAGLCVSIAGGLAPITRLVARGMSADGNSLDAGSAVDTAIELPQKSK
jgi:hypothetical protein